MDFKQIDVCDHDELYLEVLLGTSMIRVVHHHSVFSKCFNFSLFFEDYKIPELNGSNRNVRFQIKWFAALPLLLFQ